MKKMKGLLLAATIVFVQDVLAQSYAETALLFSRTKPAGSARILGMGGAQTSLGADFSSALSNPAGLGMYNRSEFAFTLGTVNLTHKGDFLGGAELISAGNASSRSTVNIPGIAVVFSKDQGQASTKGFLRGSFGMSYSRTNDFNSTMGYSGTNSYNSIIDYFIERATGVTPFDLSDEDGGYFSTPEGLAYRNYLIEDSTFFRPGASNMEYASALGVFPSNTDDIRTVFQEEQVRTSGAQSQLNFSYGANISDKFFIGAGLGFPSLRYESSKTYTESDFAFALDPDYDPLDHLTLDEKLKISGRGVNATFGAIIRPIDPFQVGISYQTPTLYNLTDTYTANLNSRWNNFDYFQDGSPPLNAIREETEAVVSEYTLKIPARINAGAAFFFEKHGFISGDVELVNYDGARYSSELTNISYDSDNEDIQELYQPVVNYKLGGEFRLKAWRFRGGYNYMPDPFTVEQNGVKRKVESASAGVGYRAPKFFADLAYIKSWGKNSYRPYTINSDLSPLVSYQTNAATIVTTLGFTF